MRALSPPTVAYSLTICDQRGHRRGGGCCEEVGAAATEIKVWTHRCRVRRREQRRGRRGRRGGERRDDVARPLFDGANRGDRSADVDRRVWRLLVLVAHRARSDVRRGC